MENIWQKTLPGPSGGSMELSISQRARDTALALCDPENRPDTDGFDRTLRELRGLNPLERTWAWLWLTQTFQRAIDGVDRDLIPRRDELRDRVFALMEAASSDIMAGFKSPEVISLLVNQDPNADPAAFLASHGIPWPDGSDPV